MAFTANSGSLTWFNLGKATDPETLADGLDNLGLSGFNPTRRTHLAALKVAMGDVFAKAEELIRPLDKKKDNGYSVVVETKGCRQNYYETTVTAKVDEETGMVACSVYEHQAELQRLTGYYRRVLSSSAVSGMLVEILRGMNGIALTDTGKPYFVPECNVTKWQAVAAVVEAAGSLDSQNGIATCPMELNASTLRDVLRRVTEEIAIETDKLRDEITKGKLGTDALVARAQHASAVREKVELYERMFNSPLSVCRQSLDTVLVAFTAACSVQDSSNTFGDVFA